MSDKIILVSSEILMCKGEATSSLFRCAKSANCFVIKEHNYLYAIDSGAGAVMRSLLKTAIKSLKDSTKNFILINTHAHVDHFSNNDIIMEVEGFNRIIHLMHENSASMFDPYASTFKHVKKFDAYYDFLEGPPPPFRTLTRALQIGGRHWALRQLVNLMIKQFEPIKPSPRTATFLGEHPGENNLFPEFRPDNFIHDDVRANAWTAPGATIIHDGAHSLDHLILFFPKKRFIITGDLTLKFFPMWPGESSGRRTEKYLKMLIKMADAEIINILADSHHKNIYKGKHEIINFLKLLLYHYQILKETILTITEGSNGISIKEIYLSLRKLRNKSPVIDDFLESQFPKTPVFLKSVISNILIEEGFKVSGFGKKAEFYLP